MPDQTAMLHVVQQNVSAQLPNILVCSRDPGSARALVPVLKLLQRHANLYCLTDGWAKKIFLSELQTETLPTPVSVLYAKDIIPPPALILVDPSSSDRGLEDYAEVHFQSAPLILLEDYYGTANLALARFAELNVVPAKICVMDALAKDLICHEYPELADRVMITGQPAFDSIVHEHTADMRQATRQRLGLTDAALVVTFFSSAHDPIELVEAIQNELIKANIPKLTLLIYWHARTGHSNGALAPFSTDQLSVASDVVMTTTSVEGIKAICRGIPSIHIRDASYPLIKAALPESFIPPPCTVGASMLVHDLHQLAPAVSNLLNTNSTTYSTQQAAIKTFYSLDGHNAERVYKIIQLVLDKAHVLS